MYDHPTKIGIRTGRIPWNKGKLIGQKPPLKLKEIWTLKGSGFRHFGDVVCHFAQLRAEPSVLGSSLRYRQRSRRLMFLHDLSIDCDRVRKDKSLTPSMLRRVANTPSSVACV